MPSSPRVSIVGTYIEEAPRGKGCERCKQLVRLISITRAAGKAEPVEILRLCGPCQAEALEVTTGYGFVNQLSHWDAFSANATELQAASRQSIKTKQKQAERAARRARRQQEGMK